MAEMTSVKRQLQPKKLELARCGGVHIVIAG
jgi:hypothetical protein